MRPGRFTSSRIMTRLYHAYSLYLKAMTVLQYFLKKRRRFLKIFIILTLKGLSDNNSNDKFSAFATGNPYFKQIAAASPRINELKQKNDEFMAAVKREEELKRAMAEEKRKTQELEELKRAADEKLRTETARLEEERRKELDRIAEAQRKEMERIA